MSTHTTFESIQNAYGPVICRRCINDIYRVNLKPADCFYAAERSICPICRENHNIVEGFTWSGKVKMMIASPRSDQGQQPEIQPASESQSSDESKTRRRRRTKSQSNSTQ